MIVDSSALVAILRGEQDAGDLMAALAAANTPRIAAPTLVETSVVVDAARDPVLSAELDQLLDTVEMVVEAFTSEHARVARQAYRDYGKGSGHPARLNLGDCFAYALTRVSREPLLYKGDDFAATDIRSALDE